MWQILTNREELKSGREVASCDPKLLKKFVACDLHAEPNRSNCTKSRPDQSIVANEYQKIPKKKREAGGTRTLYSLPNGTPLKNDRIT